MKNSPDHYTLAAGIKDIGDDFNQRIDRFAALPPFKKNLVRASRGAGLIAFCAYVVFSLNQAGVSSEKMVSGFVHAWSAPPETMIPVATWTAMLGFGGLSLVVGIQGARGPRDIMGAFWSAVYFLTCCALARWWSIYFPADWVFANFILKGLYFAGVVGSAVRFWLCVRGLNSGNALKLVKQQIQRQAVTWRTGSRRQF